MRQRPDQPQRPVPGKTGPFSRLRALPGFTSAAVAFCLTVLLGAGAPIAVAKWQQTATATIEVTAGAAAEPPAPPGFARVTQAGKMAVRPIGPDGVRCEAPYTKSDLANKDQLEITFSWDRAANATHYVVTLASDNPQFAHEAVVQEPQAAFTMPRTPSNKQGNPLNGAGADADYYAEYILRVQPMNGATAGDAVYLTYEYGHWNWSNCYYAHPAPPLPAIGSVSHSVETPAPGIRTVRFRWSASPGAAAYEVSLVSPNGWGGETATDGTFAVFELPFTESSAVFADYKLRIQPMDGEVAGDPLYRTVQYKDWGTDMHCPCTPSR